MEQSRYDSAHARRWPPKTMKRKIVTTITIFLAIVTLNAKEGVEVESSAFEVWGECPTHGAPLHLGIIRYWDACDLSYEEIESIKKEEKKYFYGRQSVLRWGESFLSDLGFFKYKLVSLCTKCKKDRFDFKQKELERELSHDGG